MKPTFKEAEKALKFIADMGLNSGTYADQKIRRISIWQQVNMSAIRSLSDSLKTTTDKVAREVLANELKLRTLVYKHEYKKKMRRRRVMKLAKDLYSRFHCTKALKTGVPEMNKNGEFSLKQVSLFGPARSYAELQTDMGDLHPYFVLHTPYNWYNEPVDLYGKELQDWMVEALEHPGYTLYGATLK